MYGIFRDHTCFTARWTNSTRFSPPIAWLYLSTVRPTVRTKPVKSLLTAAYHGLPHSANCTRRLTLVQEAVVTPLPSCGGVRCRRTPVPTSHSPHQEDWTWAWNCGDLVSRTYISYIGPLHAQPHVNTKLSTTHEKRSFLSAISSSQM